MKILHVYKDYHPVLGGIENHVRVLADAQAAAGHEVTVIVCDPGFRSRNEQRNGVRVIKAGRLCTLASMPISLAQPRAVARLPADVVHVHSPYPLGEISAWMFKRGTPLVITHHSDVVRQKAILRFYGPVLRRVLRHARCILATSPRYIETSPWLTAVRDKCVVVPLGVDHRAFAPLPAPSAPGRNLLFVGRLRYYKGLDTLIEALTELPDVRLTVAGDGPMRGAWQNLVAKVDLGDRVNFLGDVADADLPGVYHRADLFVLPANARAEAFGTVLLEAMASGLPCVTTEVGTGTSWVVQDGATGRVVPPRDPPALAAAIRDLLADPARLRAMGQAGRRRVEEHFTQEAMIEKVMTVYRDCLGGAEETPLASA